MLPLKCNRSISVIFNLALVPWKSNGITLFGECEGHIETSAMVVTIRFVEFLKL